MAIIQVWSAPSCQSGAICFGALSPWLSASGSEAQGAAPAFRCTVTRDVADAASLAEGRCLRVLSDARGEQWWFVTSVTHDDGDDGLVSVTAGSLRQLLAVRGLVRSGSTFSFAPGKQTASALITTYVLSNLSDDSLSWLSLGTMEWLDVIEVGTLDRATRGGVLDSIEQATGYTVKLRAVYTGTVLTGFAIDVLADPAAALESAPLSVGSQVNTLKRTRDALNAATVAVPFTTAGAAMTQTVWTVSSISGSAPAWLLLRDPTTGNPYPIQEDDQFIGAYVMQRDGTATIIADSRASDSAVQVASVGTIVAGDELTITRDTDGDPVIEITSPAGVASARSRLVAQVAASVTDGRSNLAQNGTLNSWSSLHAPTWYTTTTSGGIESVVQYPRTEPGGDFALLLDGFVASGASTLPLKNGTVGRRFYFNEAIGVNGVTYRIAASSVVVDSGGRVSVPVTPTTPTDLNDGIAVSVLGQTFLGSNPIRPTSFPSEPTMGPMARFLYPQGRLQASPIRIRVPAGGSTTVNVSAGISVRVPSFNNPTLSAYWPTVKIWDTAGAVALSTQASPVQTINSTAHYVLTTTAVLTTSKIVAARIEAGQDFAGGGALWQSVRWVSLWTGTGSAVAADQSNGSNLLWHRAQQVLKGVAVGTRYTVTGVDLDHLLKGAAPLALGQSVRLRSDRLGINDTVKIVRLDYRFDQTESLNLELGTITPRLTGVTFDL